MVKVKGIKTKDILLVIGSILGYAAIITGMTMTILILSWLFSNI